MLKKIMYYIGRFFEELKYNGIKGALYTTYVYCISLPTPRSRHISLLQTISFFPSKARRKAIGLIGNYFDTLCSLEGAYIFLHGSERDFSNEEVVLLAHWDPENIVDPYVLHMAHHLKQLGKKVILCSAAPLTTLPQETDIFDAIVCRTCAGYDFTR